MKMKTGVSNHSVTPVFTEYSSVSGTVLSTLHYYSILKAPV